MTRIKLSGLQLEAYEKAELVALGSRDPNKKVGCVMVSPDFRSQVSKCNSPICSIRTWTGRFVENCADYQDMKNKLTVHAELGAILKAARPLVGWSLYVTDAPCFECAKSIIRAGVAGVYCPVIDPHSRWAQAQEEARELFWEALVNYVSVEVPAA